MALYTQNGGVLLDGQVYELEFTPAPNVVTADMTLGAPLGGLTQDQGAATGPVAIAAGSGGGLFDGGSLGRALRGARHDRARRSTPRWTATPTT